MTMSETKAQEYSHGSEEGKYVLILENLVKYFLTKRVKISAKTASSRLNNPK